MWHLDGQWGLGDGEKLPEFLPSKSVPPEEATPCDIPGPPDGGIKCEPIFLIEDDEVDNTFPNDDSDANSSEAEEDFITDYEFESWPAKDPNGFKYQGKKKSFVKAVETLKINLKKGIKKQINDTWFKIIDIKKG